MQKRPLVEFLETHLTLLQKLSPKILFHRLKNKELILLAIKIAKRSKQNYHEFLNMVKNELNYIVNHTKKNLKILQPELLIFAIEDNHQELKKFLFKNLFCMDSNYSSFMKIIDDSDEQFYYLMFLISKLPKSYQIFMIKEMIFCGYTNATMFKTIRQFQQDQGQFRADDEILSIVFKECYQELIFSKKYLNMTERISDNLFRLYNSYHPFAYRDKKNPEQYLDKKITEAWERVKQASVATMKSGKLNEWSLKTIPEDLSCYVFSIMDDKKRLRYIIKMQATQIVLDLKKELYLKHMRHQSYFLTDQEKQKQKTQLSQIKNLQSFINQSYFSKQKKN